MTINGVPPGSIILHIVGSLGFGGVAKQMEIVAKVADESMIDHQVCAIGRGGAAADRIGSIPKRVWCLAGRYK